MPQLDWNELDFLDCFAVEPTVEDDAVSHDYEVERAGLRLLFTVWQLESVIQASLFRGESDDALFTFAAYVRGEVRCPIDGGHGATKFMPRGGRIEPRIGLG